MPNGASLPHCPPYVRGRQMLLPVWTRPIPTFESYSYGCVSIVVSQIPGLSALRPKLNIPGSLIHHSLLSDEVYLRIDPGHSAYGSPPYQHRSTLFCDLCVGVFLLHLMMLGLRQTRVTCHADRFIQRHRHRPRRRYNTSTTCPIVLYLEAPKFANFQTSGPMARRTFRGET